MMMIQNLARAAVAAMLVCQVFVTAPRAAAQSGGSTVTPASSEVLEASRSTLAESRVLSLASTNLLSPSAPILGIGTGRERGYSGALRTIITGAMDRLELPYLRQVLTGKRTSYQWEPLYDQPRSMLPGQAVGQRELTAPAAPGVWRLLMEGVTEPQLSSPFAVITKVPHSQKRDGYLNGYLIGRYPAEGSGRQDRYAPPEGFIEVTPENAEMFVSEHFQLKNFLTKNQFDVWPKYIALDLKLIDKLELVIQELNAMGVRADGMHVMSGFRTPEYNGPGGNGRASMSRHTYGDAADVWIDNDGDGYMDDLNGDGVIDVNDAAVIMIAVDRVERRFPHLIGGAGLYPENSVRGPFIHIDARGTYARW